MRRLNLASLAALVVVALFASVAVVVTDQAFAGTHGMMASSYSRSHSQTTTGYRSTASRQTPAKKLRVIRPEKGAGATVTYVRLMNGTVPRMMRATVLTDTRCDPDAVGVSHCLNRMRLGNGMMITVVHDHRMLDMPCLSPGERVTVTPA